jgi:hypothetical protein
MLFVMIRVVTTIAAGEHIPDALHELIRGLFDLAKIGFGARHRRAYRRAPGRNRIRGKRHACLGHGLLRDPGDRVITARAEYLRPTVATIGPFGTNTSTRLTA